jgi:hypothetical protein
MPIGRSIIPSIIKNPEIIRGKIISITGELGFEKASEFSGSSENITTTSIMPVPVFSI